MDVAMLWIRRKESDIPELIVAWDGFSIEENWEGWNKACKRALADVGSDVEAFRYVNVNVHDAALDDVFREFKTIPAAHAVEFEGPQPINVSEGEK